LGNGLKAILHYFTRISALPQLETLNQQREVTRIAYKFGQGETSQILGMESGRDRLSEQVIEVEIKRDEAVRELEQLINEAMREQGAQTRFVA
jgi:hypothetical protein